MSDQPPSSSDRRDPLGFDEILAILVAFAAIGAILWWSIGRQANNWLGQLGTAQVETAQPEGTIANTESALPDRQTQTEIPAETTVRSVEPGIVTTDGTTTIVEPQFQNNVLPEAAVVAGVPAVVGQLEPEAETPESPVPTESAAVVPGAIVVPSASPETAVSFPDLPETYWAYPFVAELTRRGMISGTQDGSFRPDQPVTRAEYAALIGKVLLDAQQGQIAFSDVSAGFWGAEPINEAVKAGFLKGYPDNTFQPEQPMTKMQVLLSLTNGFQLAKPADPAIALQVFQDQDQIPDWARPAIAGATEAGVVVNHPEAGQLNPNQPATRAEVAAMLYQALTTTGQVQPIQSPYIVRP